jgi:3-oxoacyl-[acyl-carrier protein] reductase
MAVISKLKGIVIRGLRYIFRGVPVKKISVNVVTLPPSELLKDRHALVTGGTSGIGKEIAQSFLNAGANVIITGRSAERLKKAVTELREQLHTDKIEGVVMDVSNMSVIHEGYEEAETMLGGTIDLLVNNAGVFDSKPFGSTTEEDYDLILDTNLKGVYFLSQLFARRLQSKGLSGNILNIASSSSYRPANSPYALSKWGLKGLTIGMARVLTPYGITVNGIAPGPTATPMLNIDHGKDISHDRNLTGRHATPEEIAQMAVVLTSDMGKMVVGDIVCMTGGSGNVTNEDFTFVF